MANPRSVTEQGQAALEEFGIDLVPLGAVLSPTPGWVADRLFDISAEIDEAVSDLDWEQTKAGLAKLRRFRLALDTWDVATNCS